MWKEELIAYFGIVSQNLAGGTEEEHEEARSSWLPGRDLKPASPEYVTRV